jgi:broad specificity phosphatase PhoE
MALGQWLARTAKTTTTMSMLNDNNSKHDYFWRIYSSDLGRTRYTTQLIVQQFYNLHQHHDDDDILDGDAQTQNDAVAATVSQQEPQQILPNDNNDHDDESYQPTVRYDIRLREIARGFRQGLSKECTYENAILLCNSGKHPLYKNSTTTATTTPPKLETDTDGWERVYTSFLMELINDVSKEDSTDLDTINSLNCNNCYNVLIVTHAALLRVFLQRLIGAERLQQQTEVVYKHDDINDTALPGNNRLDIPNTSLTILTIRSDRNVLRPNSSGKATADDMNGANPQLNIDIERFTSTDHLDLIDSSILNRHTSKNIV